MANESKVPCPSCVFRGPVWLDKDRKCVYCERTWANPDASIWSIVPLEWWLEEGMIKEADVPAEVRAERAAEAARSEAAKEAAG